MPCDGHLKTGLSDIRHPKVHTLAFRDLGFRLSYLALVDGPVLSSACEDTHGSMPSLEPNAGLELNNPETSLS